MAEFCRAVQADRPAAGDQVKSIGDALMLRIPDRPRPSGWDYEAQPQARHDRLTATTSAPP